MPLFSLSVVLDVDMPLYVFFWIIYIVYVAATKTLFHLTASVSESVAAHCHTVITYWVMTVLLHQFPGH